MTIDGTRYYAFSYEMPYLSFQYTRLIPTDDILNATRVTPLLNMFFILLISAACIIFFVEIYRLVHRPLSHLINAFKEMETGNFKVQIANVHSPDFAYLYQEFNKMAQKLELSKSKIIKNYSCRKRNSNSFRLRSIRIFYTTAFLCFNG